MPIDWTAWTKMINPRNKQVSKIESERNNLNRLITTNKTEPVIGKAQQRKSLGSDASTSEFNQSKRR